MCIDLAKSQSMTELNCKFLYLNELVSILILFLLLVGMLRNQGPSDFSTPTNNHGV